MEWLHIESSGEKGISFAFPFNSMPGVKPLWGARLL